MDRADRRKKLDAVRKQINERRSELVPESQNIVGEHFLRLWYPSIAKRPPDDLIRLMYVGARKDEALEIERSVKDFAELHPTNDQRSDAAIATWAVQSGSHLEGDYGQSYFRIAVRIAIAVYVEKMDNRVRSAVNRVKQRSLINSETKGVDPADLHVARQRYYCGPGWHLILDTLMNDLSQVPGVRFVSAGEKWSELEIMYVCQPEQSDAVYAATRKAAASASRTCETCGQPGSLRRKGWWKVLCDEHAGARS